VREKRMEVSIELQMWFFTVSCFFVSWQFCDLVWTVGEWFWYRKKASVLALPHKGK